MNPIRKRRLLLILALLAASGVAAALVTLALRENITYLYTPSQVYAGEAADQAVFIDHRIADSCAVPFQFYPETTGKSFSIKLG